MSQLKRRDKLEVAIATAILAAFFVFEATTLSISNPSLMRMLVIAAVVTIFGDNIAAYYQ